MFGRPLTRDPLGTCEVAITESDGQTIDSVLYTVIIQLSVVRPPDVYAQLDRNF